MKQQPWLHSLHCRLWQSRSQTPTSTHSLQADTGSRCLTGWAPAAPQVGKNTDIEVDIIIGADGANSRVAKEIGAGEYDYAIAFQVRGKTNAHGTC